MKIKDLILYYTQGFQQGSTCTIKFCMAEKFYFEKSNGKMAMELQ